MHWNSWWHAGGMWFFWLGVFAILAAAIYFGLRSLKKGEPLHESPRQILDRRFAAGEIDREEYQRAVEDLHQF